MSWGERFLASTRGRVLTLLRHSECTVSDLADSLDLSSNAVRAHLASLERDGLVEQRGLRRGVGKPAYLYGLSDSASALFPKSYDRLLSELLGILVERDGSVELESLLMEVGRRLLAGRVLPSSEGERLAAALSLLEELGGLLELEEDDGVWRLCGRSCPLGELVPSRPEVCRLTESVLSEVLDLPVHRRCEVGDRPSCLFEVERGVAAVTGVDGISGP